MQADDPQENTPSPEESRMPDDYFCGCVNNWGGPKEKSFLLVSMDRIRWVIEKAVWALNSSAETGLAALKRPPYDLLTVWTMKYNKGLGLVFVIQMFFKPQFPVRTALNKSAHLNIHHLVQKRNVKKMCGKATLRS